MMDDIQEQNEIAQEFIDIVSRPIGAQEFDEVSYTYNYYSYGTYWSSGIIATHFSLYVLTIKYTKLM